MTVTLAGIFLISSTSRVAVTTTSSRVTSFSCAREAKGNKMKKAKEKIEIKRFIKTSFAHQMGLKNFVCLTYGSRAWPKRRFGRREKGPKKIPSLSH